MKGRRRMKGRIGRILGVEGEGKAWHGKPKGEERAKTEDTCLPYRARW